MKFPSCLALMLLPACFVLAEDRVVLRPRGSSGRLTIVGSISEYNDRQIVIHSRGLRTPQRYDTRDIEAVTIGYGSKTLEGIDAFHAGDYQAALEHFRTAQDSETRDWIQRDILAWRMRCHLRLGAFSQAVPLFVQIVISESQTRHWNVAPLVWGPQQIDDSLRAAARRWLVQSGKATRLVAASLLLNDRIVAANAKQELQKLARLPDPYLSNLALAQLWRLDVQTGKPSDIALDRWEREIETMPKAIRAGPWFLLGRAFLQQSQPDRAAAAFLRVAVLHSQHDVLAPQAAFLAAQSLEELNQRSAADTMYQEVVDRYPWSSHANEAKAFLKKQNRLPAP